MCDHANPHMLFFRMHFLTKSGNNPYHNNGSTKRIEHNHNQKFCVQPGKSDDQDRNNSHMDEPGRGCTSNRSWLKDPGWFYVRFTCKRSIFFVYLYPSRGLYVPLCVSSLDERHNYRSIVNIFFIFKKSEKIFFRLDFNLREGYLNTFSRKSFDNLRINGIFYLIG